jgi:membrane protein YdbS with pleckstrin-like domain
MTASSSDPMRDARTTHDSISSLGDDQPDRPEDAREEVYYEGSPMVRGEMGMFILWTLLGLILIAAPFVWYLLRDSWWPWYVVVGLVLIGLMLMVIPVLVVKQFRYRISNYRIDFERGLLGKKIDTMELWHVDDIKFEQSFLNRLMGVGKITVLSDDQTTPNLELKGLPNPRPLFESLKQRIIAVKRQRGVIKMDMG